MVSFNFKNQNCLRFVDLKVSILNSLSRYQVESHRKENVKLNYNSYCQFSSRNYSILRPTLNPNSINKQPSYTYKKLSKLVNKFVSEIIIQN